MPRSLVDQFVLDLYYYGAIVHRDPAITRVCPICIQHVTIAHFDGHYDGCRSRWNLKALRYQFTESSLERNSAVLLPLKGGDS